jgi:hypothetical protein
MGIVSNLIGRPGWQRAAWLSDNMPAAAACAPAGHVCRLGTSPLAAAALD